jgi:hypothetical protein
MRYPVPLALLLTAAQTMTGCATYVGAGIGSVIDVASAGRAPHDVEGLAMQSLVRIHLRNGDTMDGRYEGHTFSAAEYASRYADAHSHRLKGAGLPALGDPVVLHQGRGLLARGRLQGFAPGRVIYESEDGREAAVALSRVQELTTPAGRSVSGVTLDRLQSEGQLPFRSRLALDSGTVRLEDVRRIDRPRVRNHRGKIAGTIVGAVFDVLFFVVLPSIDLER